MNIAEVNKVYGIYAWDKFTMAFNSKEEVENYLQLCGNIVSCYNPQLDNWTTSGNFTILPIDRIYANGLNIPFYKKKI